MEPVRIAGPSYFDNPERIPLVQLENHTRAAYKYLQSCTGWQTPPDLYEKVAAATIYWIGLPKREEGIVSVNNINKRCWKMNGLVEKLRCTPEATIVLKEGTFPISGSILRLLLVKSEMFEKMVATPMLESGSKVFNLSETPISTKTLGLIIEIISCPPVYFSDKEYEPYSISIPDEEGFPFYQAVEFLEIDSLREQAAKKLSFLVSHMNLEQLCEAYNFFHERTNKNSEKMKGIVLLSLCEYILKANNLADSNVHCLQLGNQKLVDHSVYKACKTEIFLPDITPAARHYLHFYSCFNRGLKGEAVVSLSEACNHERFSLTLIKAAIDLRERFSVDLNAYDSILRAYDNFFTIDPDNVEYRKKCFAYELSLFEKGGCLNIDRVCAHSDSLLTHNSEDISVAWQAMKCCLKRVQEGPLSRKNTEPNAIRYLNIALAKADPADPRILEYLIAFINNVSIIGCPMELKRRILQVATVQPRITLLWPHLLQTLRSCLS